MKKFYSLILCTIILISVINLKVHAANVTLLTSNNQVNYIEIRDDNIGSVESSFEYLINSDYYNHNMCGDGFIGLQFESMVDNRIYYLNFEFKLNGASYDIKIYIAKDTDYNPATKDYNEKYSLYEGTYNVRMTLCSSNFVFIPSYTGVENDLWKYNGYKGRVIGGPNCYDSEMQDVVEDIGDEFQFYAMVFNYKKNTNYENKSVYYLVDYNNQVSLKSIIEKIKISDLTKGDITSTLRILKNTYIKKDSEKLPLGEYILIVGGYDDSYNAVMQKIIIKVCDINSPNLIKLQDSIEVSYYDGKVTEDDIKKCFTITDNCEISNISVNLEEYTSNSKKVGTYNAYLNVSDSVSNVSTSSIQIRVVDNVKPVITFNPSTLYVTTQDNITLDDVRNCIVVKDAVDGIITDFTLTDKNNYFSNKNVVGSYTFEVKASDKSGNTQTTNFYIYVSDNDDPSISVDSNLKVVLDLGQALSQDKIIEILSQTVTKSILSVESEYFDAEYPHGEYKMIIRYDDGTTDEGVLSLSGTDDVFSDSKEKEENNNMLYALIGIGGVCILVVVGYFIYKSLKKKD